MNKYSMVIDPMRSKNFAVIIEKKTGLSFIPLNELAKSWTKKQKSFGTINSVSAPDGMYVSSPKNLTKAQQIMLEDSIKNQEEEISKPEYSYSGRHSTGKSKGKTSVSNTQIRKVPKNVKLKVITYKAGAFKNRAKRSSVISAVKSHGLRLEAKSCTFRDSSNAGLELVARSAGAAMSRRVAASYFVKDGLGNRLVRRSKTLTIKEQEQDEEKIFSKSIEVAISSKVSRFI